MRLNKGCASTNVLYHNIKGAQVTADFLCGRSSVGFPPTPPYSAVVTENSKLISVESTMQSLG